MRLITEPGVHIAEFDDGALLVISRSGKVFRANPTAAVLWAAITGSSGDPDPAAVTIAARYGIPRERALADLTALVRLLREARLIRWQP